MVKQPPLKDLLYDNIEISVTETSYVVGSKNGEKSSVKKGDDIMYDINSDDTIYLWWADTIWSDIQNWF